MDIRLIALDLDGTLYDTEKRIPPRTEQMLLRAQQKGIRVVAASARPPAGLRDVRDRLHLCEYHGLLMAYNGGRIVTADGLPVYERLIPAAEAVRLLTLLEDLPVTPIPDDGEYFYVKDPNGYKVDLECRVNGMRCIQIASWQAVTFSPAKLLLSTEPAGLSSVKSAVAARLPEAYHVVQTAPFYLEVLPKDTDKGVGLRRACERIGIPLEETVAFGDSENDIPMLRGAGLGIAMGNASEAVKAAADRVTRTNNQEGIAVALEALLHL